MNKTEIKKIKNLTNAVYNPTVKEMFLNMSMAMETKKMMEAKEKAKNRKLTVQESVAMHKRVQWMEDNFGSL